jgi:hypothetical protein
MWLQARFKGPKRQVFWVMLFSVLGAMIAGSEAFWDWTLLRSGYLENGSLSGVVMASVFFVICCSISIWSLFRLCR